MIRDKTYLDFSDVLILPKKTHINSRSEVDLTCIVRKRKDPTIFWSGVPIIAANMDTTGTFSVANVFSKYKMLTFLHKHYTFEDFLDNEFDPYYVGLTAGISDDDFEKTKKIIDKFPSIMFICLDVANGYMVNFGSIVSRYAKEFSNKFIVAGNVVTTEGVERLYSAGADICKIGIGSGSVCTTRLKTGIGMPQFSAIYNIAQYTNDVISDGGCQNPGDIAKAFGAGANFVMIGGMLAGHNETGNGIYGMSSGSAMQKYSGGIESYRTSEGKHVVLLENKGPLENAVLDILGGLRSACSYTNCRTLEQFIGTQEFIKVNNQANNLFK